ncbi:phage head morphogenesis protein [Gellertiella hungarica]|uniref:SPP1 gp7 family putative phage head morphogenesis protein n=1 Tax=Gellertiella hungarica TaxID=1572859 RepID=A0A7W6NIT7_9HYPH|nr:minor capsid protein [Gellertiella hungarica]MBB4063680.1 SPP1 gp7 family putative phage head morphogenesis protein [Gellertiella hungarica]
MTDYDIRKLVRRGKGTQITLPGIEESAGGKAAYLKALRKMLRELGGAARQARGRFDLESLARLALSLVSTAEQTVNRILNLEAQRHTDTFVNSARRALGIDLSGVVRQEDLAEFLRLVAARNASLIKNLSDDTVKRVEQAVYDNLIAGNSRETLRRALTDQLGIADSRAKLIAQDQMAKLNSELNEFRHKQAGINEYVWTTSRDERVRARHRALEGKVYRYGEPTGAEDGLAPGRPIRCRCIAKAVVQF